MAHTLSLLQQEIREYYSHISLDVGSSDRGTSLDIGRKTAQIVAIETKNIGIGSVGSSKWAGRAGYGTTCKQLGYCQITNSDSKDIPGSAGSVEY